MNKNQYMTPMQLGNLFSKLHFDIAGLSIYERAVMQTIINYINSNSESYVSYPTTTLIQKQCGVKPTTIELAKKKLVKEGWIILVSGKGKGFANHYFVVADKIIEKAKQCGFKLPDKKLKQNVIPDNKHQHKRDTTGLKQNSSKAFSKMFHGVEYDTQADYDEAKRAFECSLAMLDDDPDCPF